MATLTVDFFSSLDGNGSAHGWPGYWGKEGPELRDYLVQTLAQQAVLGRVGGEPPGVPIGAGRCAIPPYLYADHPHLPGEVNRAGASIGH